MASAEAEFMEFGNKSFSTEKAEESKWVFKFGVEYVRYELTLPEYQGRHDSFSEKSYEEVSGLGMAFGRDFYIGAGFSFALGGGFTYINNTNQDIGGAEDLEIEVYKTQKKMLYAAGEVQASINYTFDNKYVDIQPFIEGAAGIGKMEANYRYSRLPIGESSIDDRYAENYDVTSTEDFTTAKVSLGVNIIGYKGIISYLKFTTTKVFFNTRTIEGESKVYDSTTVVPYETSDSEVDDETTITMASIGMGYMF